MMDHFEKAKLEEMRALSFDELLKMSNDYSAATGRSVSWRPVVDGYLLPGTFEEMARTGEIADIPYMIGFTANDSRDAAQAIKDFCALRAEQGDKPSFAYLFSRALPGDENGAFHSADLWYVFHSFEHSWRPFTAGDKALSLKIVDYWSNFARFGDPNGREGGDWTSCSAGLPEFMVFDADENDAICTMTGDPVYRGPSARE